MSSTTLRRPRLTAKVVRGLRNIASLANADIESGALHENLDEDDPPGTDEVEAHAALAYLYALADWYEKTNADDH